MYPILLFLSLLISVQSFDDATAEIAKMIREECIEQTSVDISLIDKVNAGADLMPDPKLKCYIKCTLETTGMMSDGVVDVDAILEIMPASMRKKNEGNIRTCGTKTGADDCDTAFLTQVCWQNANKADYMLI